MRHYIGGLIELCEEIEGNYMFEIRNWCPTRLTQVNRPQASRTLTHVTHSILIYIYVPCVRCVRMRSGLFIFGILYV